MIKTIIDSLINNTKEASKPTEVLLKDILYYSAGRLKYGMRDVRTDWSVVGSVGYCVGLRPKLLHVSLTNGFTINEIIGIFGQDLFESGYKSWIRESDGRYKVIPGPLMPIEALERLWSLAKPMIAGSDESLLPVHPTWLYEIPTKGNKKCGVNFVVTRPGSISFEKVFGDRRDIFYRAGKDLWKTPLKTKRARVLIVAKEEAHDDGNMWVRSNKRFIHLVRGLIRHESSYKMLKGRLISVPMIPGGESWPEGQYDIVCSQHNIKWGTIPAGTVIEVDVQFVLDEDHDEETINPFERRKLSALSLLLAKIDPSYKDWIDQSFYSSATTVAKFMKEYTHLDLEGLIRLLQEEPKSLIALDEALKVQMGFIADPGKLAEIKLALTRKLRSAKIPGQWLAAIARNVVPVGKIWVSVHDRTDILMVKATVIRYPLTGHQSFITLEIEYRDDLPKGLAMINGSDAKYLALDGDDHILVTKPFSLFTGGEPLLSERAHVVQLDLNKMSKIGIYASGANAQGLIGYCFNAMAKTLGVRDINVRKGNLDDVQFLTNLSERLGMLLDMLAQAIKKPYELDTSAINQAARLKFKAYQHPVAALCLGKDLDEACETQWDIKIPEIMPAMVMTRGLAKIPEDVAKLLKEGLGSIESASNGHQVHEKTLSLAKQLTLWAKAQPTENIEEAAMIYYTIAVRAFNGKETSRKLSSFMDGSYLLLGRTLCEQRYSPLFE